MSDVHHHPLRYHARALPRVRSAVASRPDCTRPALWEILSLLGLAVYYALADDLYGKDAFDTAHTTGPFVLAAILVLGAVRAVRLNSFAVWTPLFWARISTAVYFAIGAVIHHYMNTTTLLYVEGFFFAQPHHIKIFNLIIVWSALVLLGATWVLGGIFPLSKQPLPLANEGHLLLLAALAIAIPGYVAKYAIVFPHAMGAYGDIVIPGFIGLLARISLAGLFLLALWVLRFAPVFVLPMFALVALDSAVGILRFSKSDAILPPLMIAIAFIQFKASFSRLLVAGGIILLLFVTLQPIVGAGRQVLADRYGTIRAGTFEQRLGILQENLSRGGAEHLEAVQSDLARLTYLHPAAAAIDYYDSGIYGRTFEDVFTVFIPRVLWPNKPTYLHGQQFTLMAKGHDNSSTWMGIYVEAYWNAGWLGVFLVMPIVGGIFFAFSRYSLWVLECRSWLHFPIVFMGMFLGVRTDGSLVTEFLVVAVMAVILHFIASAATQFVSSTAIGRAARKGQPAGRDL